MSRMGKIIRCLKESYTPPPASPIPSTLLTPPVFRRPLALEPGRRSSTRAQYSLAQEESCLTHSHDWVQNPTRRQLQSQTRYRDFECKHGPLLHLSSAIASGETRAAHLRLACAGVP